MYPYLRVVAVGVGAMMRQRLAVTDESRLSLRVWPGDIDVYPELNNGRHLVMMDLGRFDFGVRTGLISSLKRNRWGLVAAGASVRFRHRLPLFARFEMVTRIVGRDRLWFYFHHSAHYGGRTCSAGLIRAGISARTGIVPTSEVLSAVDSSLPEHIPEWVEAWLRADELRPWEREA